MKKYVLFFAQVFFIFAYALSVRGELVFPKLTGPIVDEAGLLSPETEQELQQKIQSIKQAQVVVALPNSLQGQEIEEYGYQLGRSWGIGQKEADNGLLLIIAPTERRVRIEVGYGLEGVMTDARSAQIIRRLTPFLKEGNYGQALLSGLTDIETTLKGSDLPAINPATALKTGSTTDSTGVFALIIFGVIGFLYIMSHPKGYRAQAVLDLVLLLLSIIGRGRGGKGGDDHFQGGGGNFGGGGASGRF